MPFANTKCATALTQAAAGIIEPEKLKAIFDQVDKRGETESIHDAATRASQKFTDQASYKAFDAKRTALWNARRIREIGNRVEALTSASRVKGSAHEKLFNLIGKDVSHLTPTQALEAIPTGATEAGVPTGDNAASYRDTLQQTMKGWLRDTIKKEKLVGYVKSDVYDQAVNESLEHANTKDKTAQSKLPMTAFKRLAAPDQVAVKRVAEIYNEALNRSRARVAAEGAYISQREGYMGEQTHDRAKIGTASGEKRWNNLPTHKDRDAYVKDVSGWVSGPKTADNLRRMGRLPDEGHIDPTKFSHSLFEVMTAGIRKDAPEGAPGGPSTAGNFAAEAEKARILEFKDAASYTAYQKKYGVGNKWEAMNRQIDNMMHTAATLHFFGPSAKRNFETAIDRTKLKLRKKSDLLSSVDSDAKKAQIQGNETTNPVDGESPASRDSVEAGARSGSPEAGADLLRGSAEGRPVSDQTGFLAGNRAVKDAAEKAAQLEDYKNLSTGLGKDIKGTGVPDGAVKIGEGVEHQTFLPEGSDRVTKVTKPDQFGVNIVGDKAATPVSYLTRLGLQNKIFGDDIRWEGRNEKGQTVTSQPYIKPMKDAHGGYVSPSDEDIAQTMRDHGFEPTGALGEWHNSELGVTVSDARPRNFIKDVDGVARPIDLQIRQDPGATPIGKTAPQTAAAPTPNPYSHLSPEARNAEYDKNQQQIAQLQSSKASDYLDTYLGNVNEPQNVMAKKITNIAMAWNCLAMLGGAFFSNMASLFTHHLASDYAGVGLVQSTFGPLTTAMRRLGNDEFNSFIRRSGVQMEAQLGQTALDLVSGHNQEPGGIIKNLESKFFNLTGLTPMINSVRASYVAGVANELAYNAGKAFEELPGNIQRNLTDYAIGPKEWEVLRSHAVTKFGNYDVMASDLVHNAPDEAFHGIAGSTTKTAVTGARYDLEAKLANLYRSGADYASVSHNAKTGIIMDNLVGHSNLARLTTQFATFPMAHGQLVLQRALKSQGFLPFLFKSLGGLTMTGMLTYALRNLARGQNPLADPDLWDNDKGKSVQAWGRFLAAGAGAAGVGGIASDLLFSQTYQNGRGSALQTLGGPTGSNAMEAIKFAYQGIETGKINGTEALKWAQGNTPLVNAWYLKPLINYGLMYGLEEQMNPGVIERMKQSAAANGNPFWLDPTQFSGPSVGR